MSGLSGSRIRARRWLRIAPALLTALIVYLAGCSKNPVTVDGGPRAQPPETELTYSPPESTSTLFRVHIYWYGYDRDGEVVKYRFAIDSDTLRPPSTWRATTAKDSIFSFQVTYGGLTGGHMFSIVAEDNDGLLDPTPAKRYFAIHTQPPTAWFTSGPDNFQLTGFDVKFEWTGTDPDGQRFANPALPESMVRASVPDQFEYIMLWPGRAIVEGHEPLPSFTTAGYTQLLNDAKGPTLPPPHDDWKWTLTANRDHVFTSLPPGQTVVVAVRAVDNAGARDTLLTYHRNIRTFVVRVPPPLQRLPALTLISDDLGSGVLQDSVPTTLQAEILEGTTMRFRWSAVPGGLGTPIAGYSWAVDDTTTAAWRTIDPAATSTQLTLPAGVHSFFVRVVDDAGRTVLAVVQLNVIHPAFRDAGNPSTALYVDEFAPPPGDWYAAQRGSPNFPSDANEDAWWNSTLLVPLAREFGYTFEQFDAVLAGLDSYGRPAPKLADLARHRVVIWSVDLNNTVSSPAALWTTLHAASRSALAQYVRAGGTLIVTGFQLAATTSRMTTVPISAFDPGMCSSLSPGSVTWNGEYFCRDFMGIDGAKPNDSSSRAAGARDFVEARVTARGGALGFQTAAVDTGAGAKWDPYAFFAGSNPDGLLSPGLPKVEGWKLETALGCRLDESAYRREDPTLPIALPLFTYHGANEGVLQDGAASPREDLVVGIATQAHDDGSGDGSVITAGNARDVMGRMVFLGFPIYYVRDAEAYQVMRAAFAYVNGSPTLPAGTP